jgi:glycosyltransferase involved in cell wall biosynthesis
MNNPLVTIVIPTFNQSQYLPACVDHCLFQTYSNLELIIVDGGSTDSTKEYLSNLKNKIATITHNPVVRMSGDGNIIRGEFISYPQDRKITILTFDEDIGPTRTYNEGLRKASGKYCTYVVGDDLPHPHMIEDMVAVLETQDVDFVYSDMNLIEDSGGIVRQMLQPDYNFKKCFADWFHVGVSKLYRTKLHKQVGLMDESYTAANDYDHYLRFAMAGCRFYHLPKVLYSIRWHGPERKTGQHTPNRYKILLEECKQCAARARTFLDTDTDLVNKTI